MKTYIFRLIYREQTIAVRIDAESSFDALIKAIDQFPDVDCNYAIICTPDN